MKKTRLVPVQHRTIRSPMNSASTQCPRIEDIHAKFNISWKSWFFDEFSWKSYNTRGVRHCPQPVEIIKFCEKFFQRIFLSFWSSSIRLDTNNLANLLYRLNLDRIKNIYIFMIFRYVGFSQNPRYVSYCSRYTRL